MSRSRLVRRLLVLLLAPATALLAACGSSGGSSGGGGDDALQIGFPYPATGSYASQGQASADGARLAVDLMNRAGGIDIGGRKVQVVLTTCDDEIDPAKAATCARRLATQNRAVAMPVITSAETFPILAFNQDRVSPFIVVSSSAVAKLVQSNNPLVARYGFATGQYMPTFTRGVAQVIGSTPDIAIVTVDDDYGNAYYADFKSGWEAAGGRVVGGHATYAANATDLYPQLTAVLRENPAYIVTPGVCAQATLVIKQAIELGYKGRFVVYSSCDPVTATQSVGEQALRGSIFEGTKWNLSSPQLEKFQADFRTAFGKDPQFGAASGYSMASWIMAAARQAGTTTDVARIRAAMGPALAAGEDWNLLGMSDFRDQDGEITSLVYPRLYNSASDITDYDA